MKKIVVVDGREIQQAVIAMMNRRPSLQGQFIGGVHLIADMAEKRPELRFRCNVVLFDTEKAAREYGEKDPPPADVGQLPAAPLGAEGEGKPEGETLQ